MATKIRLQRHGKKGKAFYHIIAADSRAPRDGRFIEKLGTYNPNTDPAIVELNFDKTLGWIQVGAEMSDTARAILSYKGVLYKNHLIKGIKKGALTEEQVEEKFSKWLEEKDTKISAKKDGLAKAADKELAEKLKTESEISEARVKEIQAKNAAILAAEEAPAAEVAEETPAAEEAPAAEAAEEAPAAETTEEAPAAEATEEAPAAEVAEEAPAAEDAPAAEAAEETPAAEEAPAAENADEKAE